MIRVVVISLRRSTERRAAMTAHLNSLGVPFEFFEAVDGDEMTAGEARAACARPNPRRYGQYLLPAELGCTMSYRKVCGAIAAGSEAFVCVIEDDIVLDERVLTILDETALRRFPSFDVLRLHAVSEPWLTVGRHGSLAIRAPYRLTFGTCAQIFTRSGARKAAAGLQSPWMPCDMTLYTDGLVPGLRILEVHPALARHPAAGSDRSTIDRAAINTVPKDWAAYRRWRRSAFEFGSRLRAWRNFVTLWGLAALRNLEPRNRG